MMTTEELRASFLIDLFQGKTIQLVYSDIDPSICGSAVPIEDPLPLKASMKELAAEYFLQRRELGIINIGFKGFIKVDGKDYPMDNKDALYIGRGAQDIVFHSENIKKPARFYLLSYPAHTDYPTKHAAFS